MSPPSQKTKEKQLQKSNNSSTKALTQVSNTLSPVQSSAAIIPLPVKEKPIAIQKRSVEDQVNDIMTICNNEHSSERQRYSAYVKINEFFSLDEEIDLPPIKCFAVIISQIIKGMADESKEI